MKCKFEHDGHCCNCGAKQYIIECKQPCETIVTMTNADRIRAMSDEELAEYIDSVAEECYNAGADYLPLSNSNPLSNAYNILEWLKQPAEVEPHE